MNEKMFEGNDSSDEDDENNLFVSELKWANTET